MAALPGWAELLSTVVMFANVGVFMTLLLVFGFTEPWRKSWFGAAIVLLTVGILQLSLRAIVTYFFGEDYAGRDLVLLVGRLFLNISGVALLVGLLRMKIHHPR